MTNIKVWASTAFKFVYSCHVVFIIVGVVVVGVVGGGVVVQSGLIYYEPSCAVFFSGRVTRFFPPLTQTVSS